VLGKADQGRQLLGLGRRPLLFQIAQGRVDQTEVPAESLGRDGIVTLFQRPARQILIAHLEDHELIGHFMTHGTLGTGLRGQRAVDIAVHFAALIEEILNPGALGLVGDEVELIPQPVEPVLALLVQDQLPQRRVVAVIAAGIVIARAQEPAIVRTLVGPVAAALADHESIGEDRGEAVKGRLIFGLLAHRIDKVCIAVTRMRHQDCPAGRGVLMQRRIFRDLGQRRFRLVGSA